MSRKKRRRDRDESEDRQFRLPRIWSNNQLRHLAPLCRGSVVNVSAGDDVDKQGATYREYFTAADEYHTTNWAGGSYRGFGERDDEIPLDLTAELPAELIGRYDVALNHTTLEHIFEVRTAMTNLCRMTRDAVIVVVPFAQVQHENAGYQDFWRFTPTCLRAMFAAEGLRMVYEAANNDFNAGTYVCAVASRHPDRWSERLEYRPVELAADWIGRPDVSWSDLMGLLRRKLRRD